jgi:hypothetical protein
MIDLNAVLTFSEAAEKWGFSDGNTIRKAVERKKFKDTEIRKSGNVWLTTYPAMVRVFGLPQKIDKVISYHDIASIIASSVFEHKNKDAEIDAILMDITTAIDNQQSVTIIENINHPEKILQIIRNKQDLQSFITLLKRYIASVDTSKHI